MKKKTKKTLHVITKQIKLILSFLMEKPMLSAVLVDATDEHF